MWHFDEAAPEDYRRHVWRGAGLLHLRYKYHLTWDGISVLRNKAPMITFTETIFLKPADIRIGMD